MGLIDRIAPSSVLDVGAGWGKYGVLFRMQASLLNLTLNTDGGAWRRETSVFRVDAIEPFESQLGKLHELVYDQVFKMDVQEFLSAPHKSYDLIYFGDVLEHLDHKVAEETVLPGLVDASNKAVIIQTPYEYYDQDAHFGNEYQRHRSQWRLADLKPFAPYVFGGRIRDQLIAVLTRDPSLQRTLRMDPCRPAGSFAWIPAGLVVEPVANWPVATNSARSAQRLGRAAAGSCSDRVHSGRSTAVGSVRSWGSPAPEDLLSLDGIGATRLPRDRRGGAETLLRTNVAQSRRLRSRTLCTPHRSH